MLHLMLSWKRLQNSLLQSRGLWKQKWLPIELRWKCYSPVRVLLNFRARQSLRAALFGTYDTDKTFCSEEHVITSVNVKSLLCLLSFCSLTLCPPPSGFLERCDQGCSLFWSHFVYGKHQVGVSEEPVHFTLTFVMKWLLIFSSKHLSDFSYSEMGH